MLKAILATPVEDELTARNPCLVRGASARTTAERPLLQEPQVWAIAEAVLSRDEALVRLAAAHWRR